MKNSLFLGLLSLLPVPPALAAGTVEYSIQKLPRHRDADLLRRKIDGTINPALQTYINGLDGLEYYLNVTVGTPGQNQTVILDTGSSDFWIPAESATFCASAKCTDGTFDPSKSSTYSLVTAGALNMTYGDGSEYTGDHFTDVVRIGSLIIEGATLGLAYDGSGSRMSGNGGIMGVGYSANEGLSEGATQYPNFIESLVESGAIASRLFSLYLNELSSYGSVLFGGVDTEKYSGDLTTLNLWQTDEKIPIYSFYLKIDNVTSTNDSGNEQTLTSNIDSYVLPDSGTTAWVVPDDLYQSLMNLTGVNAAESNTILCSAVPTNSTINIAFRGNSTDNTVILKVPIDSLFTPATLKSGGIYEINDEAYCQLQVQNSASVSSSIDFYLIGDAVMRAGYWVYDLDNAQVSIAQANLGTNATNIVAVKNGTTGLRDAVGQPAALAVEQKGTPAPTVSATGVYSLATAATAVGETSGVAATLSAGAPNIEVGEVVWKVVLPLSFVALGAMLC